ncbi:MAG: FecR family protein, partial [Burkholderiales bacterium]|nr:FecR family protein [Burkholderiales bacterium]
MAVLILPALAFAGMSARAEIVGQVLLAAGDVVAVRAGKALPLAPGMMIEDKDTLRTGTTGNLQLRFTDTSTMSLRENSELAIEQYRFSGRADGLERAFYRLLKGGLSTVTGLIGRTRRENYRIDTATATIGIRGTEFALMSCQAGSCLHADGSKARDGLYGGVTGGVVAAITRSGEFRFGVGETFFAASIDRPVEKLTRPPVFLHQRPTNQQSGSTGSGSSTSPGTGKSFSSKGSTSGGSDREQTTGGSNRPGKVESPEKVERSEKVERPEKVERSEKVERPE